MEKTSEYNEQHYPKLYNKFKKIKILKDSESVDDIQNFIDDKMSKL